MKKGQKRKDGTLFISQADPKAFDTARAIGIYRDKVLFFSKDPDGIKGAYNSISRGMEAKRRRGKLEDWKNGYS